MKARGFSLTLELVLWTLYHMQVILRQAAIGDEHRVAEIYLASRKRYLPYAPLAHTDDAVRSWIGSQLIPT